MRKEYLSGQFAKSASKNGDRVRDLIWFSGIDVPRFDFWTGQEWTLRLPMDLVRLDRLNDGAPLLMNHTFSRPLETQIGVVERAWLEGNTGKATVRFADTPDVADVWRKVQDGIIQNVSMEASIDEFEDVTPKGEKKKILSAKGWEVEAIALVPVGADPSAGFLSASPIWDERAHKILATTGLTGEAENPAKGRLLVKRARLRLY